MDLVFLPSAMLICLLIAAVTAEAKRKQAGYQIGI